MTQNRPSMSLDGFPARVFAPEPIVKAQDKVDVVAKPWGEGRCLAVTVIELPEAVVVLPP